MNLADNKNTNFLNARPTSDWYDHMEENSIALQLFKCIRRSMHNRYRSVIVYEHYKYIINY